MEKREGSKNYFNILVEENIDKEKNIVSPRNLKKQERKTHKKRNDAK